MANIIVSETEVLITFQKQAHNLLPIVAGFDKVDPGPLGGEVAVEGFTWMKGQILAEN